MTGGGWWPVAFEVDEVEDLHRWRSVVVHGGFYSLDPEGPSWERAELEKAIEILRTLIPATFTEEDPTPTRTVVFRIGVQEVSGRASGTPQDVVDVYMKT
jgi:nitroimidazol reductase NimA-like FMN-containing flavoprotein (pyridoxamine 5'-phosphate oxidase superfamily)